MNWLKRLLNGRQNISESRQTTEQKKASVDLAVVISEYNRGWVLETICQQIASHWPDKTEFVWTTRNRKITAPIPKARVYWFSHYQLLITALKQHPDILSGKLMVWYTHPSKPEISQNELVAALNQCHAVIFTCSIHRDSMIAAGVRPDICHVILGGADPNVFFPYEDAERKYIGFASAYYERKNPQLMESVIRAMPEEQFLLIGPKAESMGKTDRMWTNYEGFDQLLSLPNFTYIEADYEEYPRFYNQMKVFMSLSKLEGGPISIIEAMMCGCYIVATDTGFARDVLKDFHNGQIVEIDSTTNKIVQLLSTFEIDKYTNLKTHFSWFDFSNNIHRLSN